MKNLILLFAVISSILISCEDNDSPQDPYQEYTISMGNNSEEDVYFSLAQGVANTATRADWDIEFSTPMQSAAIRINEGAGVQLYSVGDTNQWETVVSFDAGNYEELLNDNSDWSNGAFNRTATGFPNYGWGTYHQGNPDHNVGGDSLYVIKLTDGSLKKFMIRSRIGLTGTYILRWADIDGSEEVNTSFSCAELYR